MIQRLPPAAYVGEDCSGVDEIILLSVQWLIRDVVTPNVEMGEVERLQPAGLKIRCHDMADVTDSLN
jgi:hypothetical protein